MILVTGTSGFIGKVFVRELINAHGADMVIGMRYKNDEFFVYDALGSLNPIEKSEKLLGKIESIYHLGAFIPKKNSDVNDINGAYSNISFTKRLLSMEMKSLKRIVYVSTLDVYDTAVQITEETPINPVSLYADSKLFCERMIDVFAKKMGIVHQILRVGHVYGPGEEKYQKLIPTAIRCFLKQGVFNLTGDGSDLRSFIFIDDVVNAMLKTLQLDAYVGPINIVSSFSYSVLEVLNFLERIAGYSIEINKKQRLGEVRNSTFNNSKMLQLFKIKETPIFEGLQQEWAYMKQIRE